MVVGATGRVGGAAVEQFLGTGLEVRALVRRPEKGALLPVVKEPAFETDGVKVDSEDLRSLWRLMA